MALEGQILTPSSTEAPAPPTEGGSEADAARRSAAEPTPALADRAVLYHASQAIIGSLDPERVYAATHEAAAQWLPCEVFLIALLDEAAQEIELVYVVDRGERGRPMRTEQGLGMSGRVIESGLALRVDGVDDLPAAERQHLGCPDPVQSLVAVPMRLGDRVIGALSAQSYAPAAYTTEHLEALTLLANQAAIAIEHARLFEAEREQRQLAEVLRETGAILSASLDLESVLDSLLAQVQRVAPYHTAAIMLRDGERYRVARLQGFEAVGAEAAALVGSLTFDLRETATLRAVVETGAPVIIADTAEFPGWVPLEVTAHIRSWIGAPMVAQGEIIAIFALDWSEPDFYQPRHARQLATFAGQAALAVKNALLFEAERRRVAAFSALHEIGLDLSQQSDLPALLRLILERAVRLLEARAGGLYLAQADGMTECAASVGYDRDFSGLRLRPGEGMAGRVMQTGQGEYTGDYAAWPWRTAALVEETVQSTAGTPIRWRERVIGVLAVTDDRPHRFGPGDVDLLALFADQAAVAIVNAQLIADARAKADELGRLYAAGQEMAASREPQVVLDALARHMCEGLQLHSASILVIDAESENITVVAEQRRDSAAATTPLGRTYRLHDYPLTARAILGQQVVAAHFDDRDLARSEQVLFAERDARTELLVPIVTRGRALGEARLWDNRSRTFSATEIRLAQTLGRQAADVIENARLFSALEDEKRRLELLYNLSQRLTASLDLGEVSRRALDLVRAALRADRAELHLPVEQGKALQLAATAGADEKAGQAESVGASLAQRAMAVRDIVLAPALLEAGPVWSRSAAAVPLVIGNSLVGVCVLLSQVDGFFGDGHQPILQAIAAPMALALQNAQLFAAEARRAHYLEALGEITRAALSDLDYQTLLNTLAHRLAVMFNAEACYLTRWDEARQLAVPSAAYGDDHATYSRFQPVAGGGQSLTAAALHAGRALAITDAFASPHISPAVAAAARMRSVLALPLVAGERRLGAAIVGFREPRRFTPQEVARAEQAARQAAVAIAKAELFDETRRRAEELATLVELSAALRVAATGQDMLPIFLQKACAVTGATASGIFLVEPVTGDLVLRASHPADERVLGMRHRMGEGITGQVALTGEAYVSSDLLHDPRADLRHPGETEFLHSVRGALAVPLRTHDGISGVMHVGREHPYPFSPNEIHLLTAIAEVAGNALQRAQLLETLEQRVAARTRELAEANERLTELDRLKDMFISNVSHELRTPLTNIKLHLSLLERRGPEVLARYLPTLQRETERLRRLIEDLLDLSRLQSKIAAPRRERHGVDGLLSEVLALHVARAEARGLTLQHHASPEPAEVYVDRAQAMQVFTNLLGNAVAYTPPGGTVGVATRRAARAEREGVEVQVHNTGSVIPPEDLPHLFERFFRGRTAADSGEAGTGLGLAICKEIVEQHQGEIGVTSNVDTGTTFTVWLPADGQGGQSSSSLSLT
jgi:GAF domain-containing protein